MSRPVVVLLHSYLVLRIVVCPCLSGENFHDGVARSFFGWAGSSSLSDDKLADRSGETEAGVCMCDGAIAPACPESPPLDLTGSPLDNLADPALISFLGVDDLIPLPSARPPTISRSPDDAPTVRALLQNFRC